MLITIPGKPISQQRHRTTMRRCLIHYDPQKADKARVTSIIQAMCNHVISGPCSIKLDFYFAKPKRHKKEPMIKKPDIDNCVKFYLDCANGILYEDDRQITHLMAAKHYSDDPCTVISIVDLSLQ